MSQLTAPKHCYLYTKIATYQGFGGPAKADNYDKLNPATPTRAGRFTINFIGPHVTARTGPGTYVWSVVPWGTPLRVSKQAKQEVVEVMLPGTGWQRLTKLPAWKHLDEQQKKVKDMVVARYAELWKLPTDLLAYKHTPAPIRLYTTVPDKWVFSDFGHVTVKYYLDANHNGRQDRRNAAENTYSDFIHTTPDHELVERLNTQANAGLYVPLGQSHGCIHAMPKEVDDMIASGYLKIGGAFVVHPYSARVVASFQEATDIPRLQTREVHFYPGQQQLVVYMVTALR